MIKKENSTSAAFLEFVPSAVRIESFFFLLLSSPVPRSVLYFLLQSRTKSTCKQVLFESGESPHKSSSLVVIASLML